MYNQAFHDRDAGTVNIRSKRGFSLDLLLKRWWYEAKTKWQEKQRR